MKNTKKILLGIFSLIIILGIINFIYAQATSTSWPAYNVCCEKTKTGAWCQNTLESNCDTSLDEKTNSPFRKTPTSCDATSFCKTGCCIDTGEGLCMENTPQRVCDTHGGTWKDNALCNVPQCDLGCCILGDQASYVTLTRCKKLSAFYGLETDFKKNIKDESSCVLIAQLEDKGACVYESEYSKTCKFLTRAECLNTNRTKNKDMTSPAVFYMNYLCSADELATNCGPTTKTTCLDGKDEVYFVDSCGNPANIYDAGKTYDKAPSYWQKIVPKAESCKFNDAHGNAGSTTCGNCQYFKGSICKAGKATYGDNACKDLNCYGTRNGKDYKNGESWCVDQGTVGEGRDTVGSRHFRHVCINGEEIIEGCADYRGEICIENILNTYAGSFIEAACRVNRWKDCIDQTEKDDCLNTDRRDCFWLKGAEFNKDSTTSDQASLDVTATATGKLKINAEKFICLPNWPPGAKHWEASGDAKTICGLATVKEEVTFEEGLFGGKKCSDNCLPLENTWAVKMNNVCASLGDCGSEFNVAGKFTNKGTIWKVNNEKKVIQGLMENTRAK